MYMSYIVHFSFANCSTRLNARVEWNKLLDPPSVQTQNDVSFFHVEVLHHEEYPAMVISQSNLTELTD